jgi:DNA-binding XRE family transcriptional regulator
MSQSFKSYVAEVESELSPASQAELDSFRARHRRGRMLTRTRQERGMTQVRLAELAGLDQAEVRRLENGRGNPTEATLLRVAAALDAEWVLVPKVHEVSGHEPA